MIARVSVAISIFATLLVGCATGTSAPTVTMSEEDAELAVYNYLYDTAVTSHGTKVLAAYMDAGGWGGQWPPNELKEQGWYIYDVKYKDDIESSPLLNDLFELAPSGECYTFCWLVYPDGDVVPITGNALRLEAELTKESGPATMTLDDAGLSVQQYLLEEATTSEGMDIVAAWADCAGLTDDPYEGDCFYAYQDGWIIVFGFGICGSAETSDLLENALGPPSEWESYLWEFYVEADGSVMPITADAINLVAAIRGD